MRSEGYGNHFVCVYIIHLRSKSNLILSDVLTRGIRYKHFVPKNTTIFFAVLA